jgi:hypothetical protein
MNSNPCRRPNLGDGMILIIAAALALAGVRQYDQGPLAGLGYSSTSIRLIFWIEEWINPWLVTMAGAALAIRLRKPRPPCRRIWRQPGTIASALGLLGLVFALLLVLGRFAVVNLRPWPSTRNPVLGFAATNHYAISLGAPMILGAWLIMAIPSRLRREPGWIDALGTIIGICSILINTTFWLCNIVFY